MRSLENHTGWVKRTLRISLAFLIAGYLIALGLYLAPSNWHPSPTLVFMICPPALLTMTVDPSLVGVLILLGPLNALIYGVVGFLIGSGVHEFADRKEP